MEDEAFYVLEGDFSFPYGNSKNKHAGKGQFRYVPKEEFHAYKNVGSPFGKLLLIIPPPQLEKFFNLVYYHPNLTAFEPHFGHAFSLNNITWSRKRQKNMA
jgi:hypothetical protein